MSQSHADLLFGRSLLIMYMAVQNNDCCTFMQSSSKCRSKIRFGKKCFNSWPGNTQNMQSGIFCLENLPMVIYRYKLFPTVHWYHKTIGGSMHHSILTDSQSTEFRVRVTYVFSLPSDHYILW